MKKVFRIVAGSSVLFLIGVFISLSPKAQVKAGAAPPSPALLKTPPPLTVQIATKSALGVKLLFSPTSTNRTYEILSKQDLHDAEWALETTIPGQPNATEGGVTIGSRTNQLFLMVRTWANSYSLAITSQPVSLSVAQGKDATFNVGASGAGQLGYQWRFNGANIPAATSNTYTRLAVQPSDAATYSVLVGDLNGSLLSSNALLTVLEPFQPRVNWYDGFPQWCLMGLSKGSNPTNWLYLTDISETCNQ